MSDVSFMRQAWDYYGDSIIGFDVIVGSQYHTVAAPPVVPMDHVEARKLLEDYRQIREESLGGTDRIFVTLRDAIDAIEQTHPIFYLTQVDDELSYQGRCESREAAHYDDCYGRE